MWSRLGCGAVLLALLLPLALQAQAGMSAQPPHVNRVTVTGSDDALEVQIETSDSVVPESQAIASPDRIVVDFPGALPAGRLRAVKVGRGALKGIRTGIFSTNPPITRVVLDLDQPLSYRVSSSGNMVTLKLAAAAIGSPSVVSAAPSPAQQTAALQKVYVSYQGGLLQIHARGATLSEILFEVQKKTGAEIPIPSGAEEEKVAVDLGPGPTHDILSQLLNGTRYNFILMDADHAHSLQKAILTVR